MMITNAMQNPRSPNVVENIKKLKLCKYFERHARFFTLKQYEHTAHVLLTKNNQGTTLGA